MNASAVRAAPGLVALLALSACGGAGTVPGGAPPSAGPATAQPQVQASVPVLLSDAPSANWAMVGVRVLSIDLMPQAGGPSVRVYTAPSTAPYFNIEQLDHIGELLGTAAVPAGQYSSALLTVSANSGDVLLTSSEDPQQDFAGSASTTVDAAHIQVQDVRGANGAQSVPITVPFSSPLAVDSHGRASSPLQLEFHLAQPSFLVSQTPADAGATLWAVNFQGPVTSRSIGDITSLVLRQFYGSVASVAADGRTLNIDRDYPTEPAVSPETALSSSQALTILADGANGTLFDDLDDGTHMSVTSFSGLAGLAAGRYLRISARYQADGSLVATHLWVANEFQNVWCSPEGHVIQVDSNNGTLTIEDESGHPVHVRIADQTEFDFHGTPIGTGPPFLASGAIVRGFKVHVSPVDPRATQLTAASVDIEAAEFSGAISAPSAVGFTYTSDFTQRADDYQRALYYISPATPNGTDAAGNPLSGYAYWNFAFPSELAYGSTAIGAFVATTSGSIQAYGSSLATWNDPANPDGWAVRSTVLLPVPLGLATVSTGLVDSGVTASFSVTTAAAGAATTIQLITVSGSAPLVYEVDRQDPGNGGPGARSAAGNGNGNGNDQGNAGNGGRLTETLVDITTASGLAQLQSALVPGAKVKVFGVPKADGTLQAYTLFYYTGTQPVK